MDRVYVVVFLLVVSTILFVTMTPFFALALSLSILFLIGAILKEGNPLFYIVPLLFSVRFLFGVYHKDLNINERYIVESRIFASRGRIEKIDGKYPSKNLYISVDELSDGKYILDTMLTSKSTKYGKITYKGKNENTPELVEENILEKLLNSHIDKISENSSPSEGNIFRGVITGNRDRISSQVTTLFARSGISHILAISGLHLAFFVIILKSILKKLPVSRRGESILVILLLTLYVIGIRGGASVLRAYLMFLVLELSKLMYEKYSMMKSLAVSFLITMVINPTSYLDTSYVLTYSAMVGILLVNKMMIYIEEKIKERIEMKEKNKENKEEKNKISEKYENKAKEKILGYSTALLKYIVFTLSLQLFLAPLTYFYFGKFSFLSIVLSLIFTPLGTIYVILAFLSLLGFSSTFSLIFLADLWYNYLIKLMEVFN